MSLFFKEMAEIEILKYHPAFGTGNTILAFTCPFAPLSCAQEITELSNFRSHIRTGFPFSSKILLFALNLVVLCANTYKSYIFPMQNYARYLLLILFTLNDETYISRNAKKAPTF